MASIYNYNKYKDYYKSYYQKNKNKIIDYNKAKYEEQKDTKLKYRKEYYEKNKIEIAQKTKVYKQRYKERRNLLEKNKRDNDSKYRLTVNIRSLINKAFRERKIAKNQKATEILGCTIEEFIEYIQSKFVEGMTLENHGEWHIDHIIPVSSAKTEEELIKLNHYTNLQPLWAVENLRKGTKIL